MQEAIYVCAVGVIGNIGPHACDHGVLGGTLREDVKLGMDYVNDHGDWFFSDV
jgi:hypothetical protein